MATPKRIFFDTDTLDQAWPGVSVKVQNVLTAARKLGLSVELPKPVMIELQKHWRSKTYETLKRLDEDLREIRDLIDTPPLPNEIPTIESLSTAYEKCVAELLDRWGIAVTPTSQVTAEELFHQVNEDRLVFEQGGRHFKDAVIFQTIVERMQEFKDERALFISNDGRFQARKEELTAFAFERGVSLDCRNIADSEQQMTAMLDDQIRARFQRHKGARDCDNGYAYRRSTKVNK